MRWAVIGGAAGLVLAASLFASTAVASAGAPRGTSYSPQAEAACNKAIARNSVIGNKILATCRHGYILDRQACAKAGEVDWLTGPGNVTVLMKVGKRPQGYTESNFYDSSISKLCGDPIDPELTPPPKPMSAARLRHFFG